VCPKVVLPQHNNRFGERPTFGFALEGPGRGGCREFRGSRRLFARGPDWRPAFRMAEFCPQPGSDMWANAMMPAVVCGEALRRTDCSELGDGAPAKVPLRRFPWMRVSCGGSLGGGSLLKVSLEDVFGEGSLGRGGLPMMSLWLSYCLLIVSL
jgi:hypothetical protein